MNKELKENIILNYILKGVISVNILNAFGIFFALKGDDN